jgi:hypothetical protein
MAAFALSESEPERALTLVREAVARTGPQEQNNTWAIAGEVAARNGETREALVYFGRAIDSYAWLGERITVGVMAERVAGLLADGDPEATAVLQGFSAALAPDFAHAPGTVEAHDRSVATVDAALGAERRRALHERGMAMSVAEAVVYIDAAIARRVADGAP